MDDEPPIEDTYYSDHPYTDDSDNIIGAKIPLYQRGDATRRGRQSKSRFFWDTHWNTSHQHNYGLIYVSGSVSRWDRHILISKPDI